MKKKFISTNMKIFLLVLFLLSMTLYASGCIALVQSGYKLSDYADELNIDHQTFKFKFNLNKLNFDFDNSYISMNYPVNDNINEIDLNLNSQDVKVVNYDGEDLKVQIESHSVLSGELPKTESGNKLILNTRYDTPSNSSISLSIPYNFNDRGVLKIITSSGDINISNLSMNTLNLSTASGDIGVFGTTLNYLKLNNSSGDINFNNLTTLNETKLTSSSGDIIGSGTLGTVNGGTSSGDINLQFRNSLSNTFLSTDSGSVTLSLPINLGYKLNYETTSGNLESSNKQLSSGDESSLIDINTISGDLDIK
ncbi:hypothetical protein DIC82_02745 [Clostridium beijerinckii]|nr:hypothetical protein DIC82_02745 [Clostridium beijerinckii]